MERVLSGMWSVYVWHGMDELARTKSSPADCVACFTTFSFTSILINILIFGSQRVCRL